MEMAFPSARFGGVRATRSRCSDRWLLLPPGPFPSWRSPLADLVVGLSDRAVEDGVVEVLEWGKHLVDFTSTSMLAVLRCVLPLESGSNYQVRPLLLLSDESLGLLTGWWRRPGVFGLSWRRHSRGGRGMWSSCVVIGGGGGARLSWLPALVVASLSFRIFQRLLALFACELLAGGGRPRVWYGLDEGEIRQLPEAAGGGVDVLQAVWFFMSTAIAVVWILWFCCSACTRSSAASW